MIWDIFGRFLIHTGPQWVGKGPAEEFAGYAAFRRIKPREHCRTPIVNVGRWLWQHQKKISKKQLSIKVIYQRVLTTFWVQGLKNGPNCWNKDKLLIKLVVQRKSFKNRTLAVTTSEKNLKKQLLNKVIYKGVLTTVSVRGTGYSFWDRLCNLVQIINWKNDSCKFE